MSVSKEQQQQANATSSTIVKAVKVLVVIVAGISGIFLLKLLSVLRNKKSRKITEKEANDQITQIKDEWYIRVSKSVSDAWTRGINLGMVASKAQGVQPRGSGVRDVVTLDSILKDLRRSIDDAETLLRNSVETSGESGVENIIKIITLRQQMSAEAALKYAVAETMESELASPDTQKMWVSTNPKEACSHCIRLHGMVRDWGEEFPHQFPGLYKLKVYGGVLLGPLRHPNCRCILIAIPKEKSNA
jgi:hypothetical protein